MKQTQFQIAINRPPWTNRFSVISRHTVIKNFDRFWQFIDVAQNTRQNANNRAKTYSWPVQIAKSGQMFVLPSAATFECQDLVAPNLLHFPPTLGARDNLINWKSDDLFFAVSGKGLFRIRTDWLLPGWWGGWGGGCSGGVSKRSPVVSSGSIVFTLADLSNPQGVSISYLTVFFFGTRFFFLAKI